jgi:hypothetical protein
MVGIGSRRVGWFCMHCCMVRAAATAQWRVSGAGPDRAPADYIPHQVKLTRSSRLLRTTATYRLACSKAIALLGSTAPLLTAAHPTHPQYPKALEQHMWQGGSPGVVPGAAPAALTAEAFEGGVGAGATSSGHLARVGAVDAATL